MSGAVDVVGDVVGEVVGDVAGEVVGDVVGEVVGDVVGEVVAASQHSSNKLYRSRIVSPKGGTMHHCVAGSPS